MSTGHFLPSFRQVLTCSKLGNFLFDFRHLGNKKDLKLCFKSYLVQMAGIEPARFIQPQDFKSCASASSATSAFLLARMIILLFYINCQHFFKFFICFLLCRFLLLLVDVFFLIFSNIWYILIWFQNL